MARSLGVLLALVLAGRPGASAARGGAAGEEPSRTVIRATVPRVGISVAYPSNWQMRSKPLNGVLGPITRFTVTSFPLRQPEPDPDFCARTLNDQWPATGVWMQLTEELDGAAPGQGDRLLRLPQRSKHLERFRRA